VVGVWGVLLKFDYKYYTFTEYSFRRRDSSQLRAQRHIYRRLRTKFHQLTLEDRFHNLLTTLLIVQFRSRGGQTLKNLEEIRGEIVPHTHSSKVLVCVPQSWWNLVRRRLYVYIYKTHPLGTLGTNRFPTELRAQSDTRHDAISVSVSGFSKKRYKDTKNAKIRSDKKKTLLVLL